MLLSAMAEGARADQIEYECGSLVVIGRMTDQNFTHLPNPDDIIGHGRIDFDLKVHQVLRGKETRKTIPARSVAHSYARESIDFLFVLKPAADGRYDVVSGRVLAPGQAQPRLALHCTKPESVSRSD